jgi:hypothetical protein
VSPAEFRENLLAMIRAARGAGARVVLLDLVLIGPVFREAIAEIARQESVPWLDGREILRPASRSARRPAHQRSGRRSIAWDREVEQCASSTTTGLLSQAGSRSIRNGLCAT